MRQTHIKSKVLSIALAFLIAVTMTPCWAIMTTSEASADEYEAQITKSDGYTVESFQSLAAAIDTADRDDSYKGCTIKICKDITTNGTTSTSNRAPYCIDGGDMTIDGQDHTITIATTGSNDKGNYVFNCRGKVAFKKLNIVKGNCSNNNKFKGCVNVCVNNADNGNATFENCDFDATDDSNLWGTAAIIAGKNSTVTVNSGTYKGGKANGTDWQGINAEGNSMLTVNGGTTNGIKLDGDDVNYQINGGIHKEKGLFLGTPETTHPESYRYSKHVTGGYFANNVADFCAEGYECVEDTSIDGCNYKVQAEVVAKIGETTYSTLNAAITAAESGQTVEILKADTYKLPAIPKNITIKGDVDGVVFDCVWTGDPNAGEKNICSVPNGCTFDNVKFNFANANYHGFTHAGNITMKNCELNGLLFSYGNMSFENCTFNQGSVEYHMWCYAGNCSYNNCTFNGKGKFLHLYNEGNANVKEGLTEPWNVTIEGCTFVNSDNSANKAALNVKETYSTTNILHYNVGISGKNILTGNFPSNSSTASKDVLCDGLVMVDCKIEKHENGDEIKITANEGASVVVNSEEKTLPAGTVYATPADVKAVAKIGETTYSTLDAAITAAADNDTITMLSDVTLEKEITIDANKKFTLDLNGKTIKNAETGFDFATTKTALADGVPLRFMIVNYGDITICDNTESKSGIIQANSYNYGTTKAMLVYGNGKVTVNSGTIHGDYAGIYVIGNTALKDFDKQPIYPELTLNGGTVTGLYGVSAKGATAKITVNAGATVTASGEAAICTNGTIDWYDGGHNEIIINGGNINSTASEGSALYNPSDNTVEIKGGTLTGATAVIVKGGNVTVSGEATLTATGVKKDPSAGSSEGTCTGDALYIEDTYTDHKPVVTVTGGKFSSQNGETVQYFTNKEDEATDKGSVSLVGGLYNKAPYNGYVANGYEVVDNTAEDTKTAYPKKIQKKAVAQIGDVKYSTLQAAIDAAPAITEGSSTPTEIDVIADINEEFAGSYGITIPSNKNILLDLNGHTVTGKGTHWEQKQDGKYDGTSYYIYNKGHLEIQDSSDGKNGLITFTADKPDSDYGYGTSTILNRGVLTMTSGKVQNTTSGGASYAVDSQTLWYDDLIPIQFFMNGGEVECTSGDAAIRQAATLGEKYTKQGTIVDNQMTISAGKVTGDIWIQSAAVEGVGSHSTLNITGGEIIGKVYDTLTGNGSHLKYNFTGGRIGEIDMHRTGKGSFKTGFVSGGYFKTEVLASEVASGNQCILIAKKPNPTDEDRTAQQAGYIYTIAEAAQNVASITSGGETKNYPSLAAAIAAVQDDQTITMLANVTGAHGISVPSGKKFTVDFDGHSYSVGTPGAGSSGTQTNAFQLLKSSNITFKNGTISCTEANKTATWTSTDTEKGIAMIIQNYANLTLENMTINGTNIAHNGTNVRYIMSNNSGTVNIKNSTITAPKGDYAFDSCKYDEYAAPTVNVEGTNENPSTINGKIEITGGTVNLKSDATVHGQIRVGEYKSSGDTYTGAKDGTLNIENGATVDTNGLTSNKYAVIVFGPNTANIAGTINGEISTSGNKWGAGSVINVLDGANITNNTDEEQVGIYMPNGTLNITGGEITGKTAVYFKSTNLNITGGKLTGTGEHAKYDYSGNGCNATGDALVIDSCNYPSGIDNVRVMGGYFRSTGSNTAAIKAFTSQGGTPVTHFITGGHFSSDPSAEKDSDSKSIYVAEGKAVVEDTQANKADGYNYTIAVASITTGESSTTYYDSLLAAIAEVQDGQTITLLTDINDAVGISIDKKTNMEFTIDFAGHEYIVSKPGAGSTGTETIAFQLAKNQTITFKNGTIKCGEDNLITATGKDKNIKRIIQNYSNLTLENMTIDGTNLYVKNESGEYDKNTNRTVIESENGIVSIKGSTSIIDKMSDGEVAAINVARNNSYAGGTQVTVNTTGKIGTIRCYNETSSAFTPSSLTINDGKIQNIVEVGTIDGNNVVQLNGGVYAKELKKAEYYPSGKKAVKNTDEKTSAEYPWTVGEQSKVIITTTSKMLDKDGNEKDVTHIATLSGGGQYEAGASVTLKASPIDNFKFLGWYKGDVRVSEKMEYTFDAPSETTGNAIEYVAKYQANEAQATVTVSKSGNAQEKGTVVVTEQGQSTPSDTKKTVDVGNTVTLEATIDNTKAGVCYFIAWQNKNGAVLSTEPSYTTTVLQSQEVEAVFLNEGAAIVNFNDENGNLLKSGMFAASDAKSVTAVAISKKGQTYTGWKGDNGTPLSNDDVNKMIQTAADEATARAIAGKGSALGTVNVKAAYGAIATYTVTLQPVNAAGENIGAPVTVNKNVGDAVVLTAAEKIAGLNFQGFKKATTETNYITKSSKLTINPDEGGTYNYVAVYTDEQSTGESLAVITMGTPYDASTSVPKIGLTMSWSLPQGATLVEAGFYYDYNSNNLSSLSIDEDYKFTTTLKGTTGSYTSNVNVTGLTECEFGFVAFVKYKIGSGNTITVIKGTSGIGGTVLETAPPVMTNDFTKVKYSSQNNWKYNMRTINN